MSNLDLVLVAITVLIPVTGFIMTISHARAADTISGQRRRKSHGLLYWTLIPSIAGAIILYGLFQHQSKTYGVIGIAILASGTLLSWLIGRRYEDE